MCGRYSLTTPVEALRSLFRLVGNPNLPPRFNIAPTQDAAVVRPVQGGAERELAMLRWGLVPSWSRGPDSRYGMINARAETVAEKPAYRAAFRQRRCLVPADGFYEWRQQGGRKQPYRFCLKEGGAFALAGLWESWSGGENETIESFTIIVTDANALVRPIHDRMPVIVDPVDHDAWLDAEGTAVSEALALLRPFEAEAMTAYPVSPRVNSPRNDDAECVAPIEGPAPA